MPQREIEDRFLATYLEDAQQDRVRPLAEYQALFPGHESTVAREYRLLEEDELGDGSSAAPTAAGRTIGRYQLREELGRGGQARVYLAHDPRLGRDVALKVLETSRFGLDVEVRMRRFRREAELAARLDHPGICSVLDVGQDEAGGVVFIAMRLLEGCTLADWIERESASGAKPRVVSLPASEDSSASATTGRAQRRSGDRQLHRVLEVVEKIARALHAAHEQGLVHRDIKPANIMISPLGDPVILDFGLARDTASEEFGLTRSGDVLGTPYYMSPEQVRGEHSSIDRRTDVYSLGVVLYECLTLSRPFQHQSREELYRQILLEPPPDPRRWSVGIGKDLRIVLQTALEKDRSRRYPTALAFAEELARVRRYEPIVARRIPATLRARRWVQRNPGVSAFVGLLIVALVATLGLLWQVTASNERLERVRIAAALRQVGESIDNGLAGQEAIRRGLLQSVPKAEQGFAWSWLDERNEPPEALLELPSETPPRAVAFGVEGRELLVVRMGPGTTMASASVRNGDLWRASLETRTWVGRVGPAHALEVSSSQGLIFVGDVERGVIQLYDARSFAPLRSYPHGAAVTALCCSRDGRRLASGGADGSIRLWRLARTPAQGVALIDETPMGLPGFEATVRAIDLSPDGHRLVIAGVKPTVWLLDRTASKPLEIDPFSLDDRQRVTTEAEFRELVVSAARFSPDGRFVVVADAVGRVKLFRAADGKLHRELRPHHATRHGAHRASDARFDPTGRLLVTCGSDGNVQVHDVGSGERLGYLAGGGHQLALALDASGFRVVVTQVRSDRIVGSSSVAAWDLSALPIPIELVGDDERFAGHQAITTRDLRYVYTVSGRDVRKFELATGRLVFLLRDFYRMPTCIALRPGEQELAIGYQSGHCEVVDAATGQRLLRSYRAPQELVWPVPDYWATGFYSLAFSPDGRRLVGGLGTHRLGHEPGRELPLLVLDADRLIELRRVPGHRGAGVVDLRFDSDGSRLASLDYARRLTFWATGEWAPVERFGRGDGGIRFSTGPDQRVWRSVGMDRIASYEFSTGHETRYASAFRAAVFDVHPNGRELAVAERSGFGIWDMPGQNRLLSLPRTLTALDLADRMVRFVGDLGVLTAGGRNSSHWYHLARADAALHRVRQVEIAAARSVQTLLDDGYTVADARQSITGAPHLDRQVRAAALRVLDAVPEDPGSVMAWHFLRFARNPGPDEIERTIRTMRQLEQAPDPGPYVRRAILTTLGTACFMANRDREAMSALERAVAIQNPGYPGGWEPQIFRDFQSYAWFLRAMAAHRLADDAARRESLEGAWAAGIGGRNDRQAARRAYAMFKLVPRVPNGPVDTAWRATGPPDAERHRDSNLAWYPEPADEGRHVLELEFDSAVRVAEVRIYEVNVPGSVVAITCVDPSGEPHEWPVDAEQPESGTLIVKPPTGLELVTKTVRLHIDAARRTGENGIDTVRLVGAGGKAQWPVRASAQRR